MDFFPFDKGIFVFVEQADGRKSTIRFSDKDFFHVRRIAQTYPLPGKTAVHFVFHLINGDDAVDGDAALELQQKRLFDFFIGKTTDVLGF